MQSCWKDEEGSSTSDMIQRFYLYKKAMIVMLGLVEIVDGKVRCDEAINVKGQCAGNFLPLGRSFNNSTQKPAIPKTTVLVYTGIDRSIVSSIPPRMGAIIPPLQELN